MEIKGFLKEIHIIPATLIIGGGIAGILTAEELDKRGIPAVIVERGSELGGKALSAGSFFQNNVNPHAWVESKIASLKDSGVRILTNTTVTDVQGTAGNFLVTVEGEVREDIKVGAIVAATGFETASISLWETEGREEIFVGLFQLEKIIKTLTVSRPKRFVFLLREDSYSYGTAGVLKNALFLKKQGHQVFVFYNEMKISLENLGKVYHHCRDAGITFTRKAKNLKLELVRHVNEVHYIDPLLPELLCKEIAVRFDYLVYNEKVVPSTGTKELQQLLKVNCGPEGFFQEDNYHLNPVKSNRVGVYFVGACKGHEFIPAAAADAAVCAGEIALLPKRAQEVNSKPVVNPDLCACCLTCYRSCPSGAIEMDYSHRAAFINPVACECCGICAAECPGNAITFPEGFDLLQKQLALLGGN